MIEIYRNLFLLICLALLIWGVVRVERIYQYPFFMGMIFVSFLLPQVFALIDHPSPVTEVALERVLLMSSLCAGACLIGYQMKPNRIWLQRLNIPIDQRKLTRAGIGLTAYGWFFYFLLSRTPPQTTTVGTWTGPATIYYFFSQVLNIGLGIFLLKFLKKPSFFNLILTVIGAWYLVQQIINGRRQPTMTLLIILGFSLWLIYGLIPPRLVVIVALVFMTFLIPLFGELRGDFWTLVFSGNWQEVLSASQKAFTFLLKGEVLELKNAALFMDTVEFTGSYGYGTSWWDAIVFQFVPGQIVSPELKQSLQFKWGAENMGVLIDRYAYIPPPGATFTGIGDAFIEFNYLGCLSFAFIGYIFKHLWISAVYQKSTFSRLIYMGLVSPSMLALTHGIARFWQEAIFQLIFIGLVTYYSKTKYVEPHYTSSTTT